MDASKRNNSIQVPLLARKKMPTITEMSESLDLKRKSLLMSNMVNSSLETSKEENLNKSSILNLDEDVLARVQQLYSDEKLLKRYSVATQKFHKNLKCFNSIPSISPQHIGIIAWKIFIIFLTIVYFFELPVYIFFGPEIFEFAAPYGINVFGSLSVLAFFIDIFVEFQTAYFVHGNPVFKKSKIAYNYLITYFFYDLIADIIFAGRILSQSSQQRWIYFIFVLKIPSFLKTDNHFEELLLLHRKARVAHLVYRTLLFLFTLINFFACVFYYVGKISVFLLNTFIFLQIENELDSWLLYDGNFGVINDMELSQKYFFAIYFSLGTLSSCMGYGDITPMNIFECTLATMGMLFGIFIFVFNMNDIYDIVQKHNDLKRSMIKDKIAIHRFMRDKEISPLTKSRINQYLNEFWYAEGAREFQTEQRILTWLGPELKKQLLFEAYSPFIKNVPQFSNFTDLFLHEITQFVGEIRLSKGENILKAKQLHDPNSKGSSNDIQHEATNTQQSQTLLTQICIYYVKKGSVVVHPTQNIKTILKKLKEGQIFGELSFITGLLLQMQIFKGQARQASVSTSSYAHLYVLTRKDFLDTLSKFPQDYQLFCMFKDQILLNQKIDPRYNPLNISQICYTCEQLGHISTHCPKSHYMPDYDQIKEVVVTFINQLLGGSRYAIEKETSETQNQWQEMENTTKSRRYRISIRKSLKGKQWQKIISKKLSYSQNQGNNLKRQSTMLMSTMRQSKIARVVDDEDDEDNTEFFDQLDEPMDYQYFFPNHNISALVDTYNQVQEENLKEFSQLSYSGVDENYKVGNYRITRIIQ